MKGIYALYDKTAESIYNETLDILADYRALKAAWIDNLKDSKGLYGNYPEQFKIVKVGEINGNNIHIYETYQTMDELVDLINKS